MFGRAQKSEVSEELEIRPKAFSRRDVFRFLAGAGATIALESIPAEASTLSKESETHWEKVRAEGIAFLKEQALTKEDEQVSFFIRKGDAGEWLHFGKTGGDTYARIPFEKLESLLADPEVHVEVFHTHPLHTIMRNRGVVMAEGIAPDPTPMPPSFQDILSRVMFINLLGEKSDRVTTAVVDPVGTWQYTIDKNNSTMRKFAKILSDLSHLSEHITPELQQELDAFAEKQGMGNSDPRLIGMLLQEHMSELSLPLQKMLEEALKPLLTLMKSRVVTELAEAAELDFATKNLKDPHEREEVIRAYRRAGIMLTFTPHPSGVEVVH